MRISLLGYMGSGKSTFGKKLAKKLNLEFIDLDNFIEDSVGKSIPEIFSEKGEEVFREFEKKSLRTVLGKRNVLISLGGGTPCFGDNMEEVNNESISIYLDLPPKALFSRLKNVKASRPLIADKNDVELLSFIETHLSERDSYYKRARIVFNPIQEKEEKLLELINAYSK